MTPSEAIASLDMSVAEDGESVTLVQAGEYFARQAFVRGYKPQEFANGIQNGDTLVVLSPTQLVGTSIEKPQVGGKIIVDGRPRRILNAVQVSIHGVPVRFNLTVRD